MFTIARSGGAGCKIRKIPQASILSHRPPVDDRGRDAVPCRSVVYFAGYGKITHGLRNTLSPLGPVSAAVPPESYGKYAECKLPGGRLYAGLPAMTDDVSLLRSGNNGLLVYCVPAPVAAADISSPLCSAVIEASCIQTEMDKAFEGWMRSGSQSSDRTMLSCVAGVEPSPRFVTNLRRNSPDAEKNFIVCMPSASLWGLSRPPLRKPVFPYAVGFSNRLSATSVTGAPSSDCLEPSQFGQDVISTLSSQAEMIQFRDPAAVSGTTAGTGSLLGAVPIMVAGICRKINGVDLASWADVIAITDEMLRAADGAAAAESEGSLDSFLSTSDPQLSAAAAAGFKGCFAKQGLMPNENAADVHEELMNSSPFFRGEVPVSALLGEHQLTGLDIAADSHDFCRKVITSFIQGARIAYNEMLGDTNGELHLSDGFIRTLIVHLGYCLEVSRIISNGNEAKNENVEIASIANQGTRVFSKHGITRAFAIALVPFFNLI